MTALPADTPAGVALGLFTSRPADGGNKIDWLADQLLTLAVGTPALSMGLVPDDPGTGAVRLEVADSVHRLTSTDPTPLRLFRTLLARLAKLSADESATNFDPYHGRYVLTRSRREDGPVRLEVEIDNTTVEPRLRITRVAPPARPATPVGNGTAAHAAEPQHPVG